jgi:drug/metabolite transporter (DMT)-like permease
MEKAIVLAVAACLCTATASVCQRKGARSTETAGFDLRLMFRLARQPVWVLGIASMILGFVFQLTALHFGDLALVQPILAAELLFVFGYLAVAGSRRVRRRDWLAAAAMSAGIGLFLRLASPSGGRLHAPGSWWLLAGLVTAGVVAGALAVAFGLGHRPGAPGSRRAAVLGAATGISWGFIAAVIKELSSHIDDGIGAVFCTWSPYVLIAAGAATLLLASHALAAGPLAASQPGFTILDPFSASLLGVFLFGEHIRTGLMDLAGEALALGVVIAGAVVLSRSCLIAGENGRRTYQHTPALTSAVSSLPATRPPAPDPAGTGTTRTRRHPALSPDAAACAGTPLRAPAPVTAGRAAAPGPIGEIKILMPGGLRLDHAEGAGPRGAARPAGRIIPPRCPQSRHERPLSRSSARATRTTRRRPPGHSAATTTARAALPASGSHGFVSSTSHGTTTVSIS